MKNMFRITLYLFALLTIFSICHAGNNQEDVNNISGQNDQIIKTAHMSGGFIFATPPYWGRENTQAGFKKYSKPGRKSFCFWFKRINRWVQVSHGVDDRE